MQKKKKKLKKIKYNDIINMSLQTSRFHGQEVVNSFNLFVDTEKSSVVGDGQSKGDDVHIHFQNQTLQAGDGEYIKLSLVNFTMFNNLHQVNKNNSAVKVYGTGPSGAFETSFNLERKNYSCLKDLATSFATQLGAALTPNSTAASYENTTILPASTSMSATDNRLLNITLTSKNGGGSTVAHDITALKIQTRAVDGDSNVILGGLRLDDSTDETFQSFKVTGVTSSATTIQVQGYFPMQRLSDPYVYLRCSSQQNGLEMSVLSNDRGSFATDVLNSDILAKMFKDTEFINYDSTTGDEYFMHLQQRKVANLRLFLTDSKGRKLGRRSAERDTGTAAGLADGTGSFLNLNQSTLGNLSFTAVIRVDIIRNSMPQKLQSEGPKPLLPARLGQSVYQFQDQGMPKL